MATTVPLTDPGALPSKSGLLRPRRPIAKLMLVMLALKIAYDVVLRRWAATISGPDKG